MFRKTPRCPFCNERVPRDTFYCPHGGELLASLADLQKRREERFPPKPEDAVHVSRLFVDERHELKTAEYIYDAALPVL